MGASARAGDAIVRTRMVRVVILLAIAGSSPAAASGASVELRGDRVVIRGGDQPDRLQLERADERFRISERRSGRQLTTSSAACQRIGPRKVECPAVGVDAIDVSTGAGSDRFVVGRYFPASNERAGCDRNDLGASLQVRTDGGRDYAELSAGADRAMGGAGRDLLLGCQGDDRIRGGAASDRLSGDEGNDSLAGGKGSDWLVGCVFDPDDLNYPRGEPGKDELRAGGGADFLYGCQGADRYRAAAGDDTLNARDGRREKLACGRGSDLVYADRPEQLRSCERSTDCTTDNFPFYPCSSRRRVWAAADKEGGSPLGNRWRPARITTG